MRKYSSNAFTSINKNTEKSIRTITLSHYLAHTEPLFERLDILDMKKLVMQRITLIMFKNYVNILTTPLNDLFRINNTRY